MPIEKMTKQSIAEQVQQGCLSVPVLTPDERDSLAVFEVDSLLSFVWPNISYDHLSKGKHYSSPPASIVTVLK